MNIGAPGRQDNSRTQAVPGKSGLGEGKGGSDDAENNDGQSVV